MFLKTIVCSGVNEKNDVDDAIRFLKEHSCIEFGVQCSPRKAGYQTPRFEWLQELTAKLAEKQIKGRIALHLNEGFATSFCEGMVPPEIIELLNNDNIIGRLQLNFKIGRETFNGKTTPDFTKLQNAVSSVPTHRIILSASRPNLPFIQMAHHHGMPFDVLFDDSFGEGKLPDTQRPPLFEDVFQGYAGGLSPENIVQELDKISKVAKTNIFIDAEGKLKDNNSFSFERATQFVQNALNWNRLHLPTNQHEML